MKQLYSAGPLAPGTSPAVAAASPGLRPEDVAAALPLTAYSSPAAGDGSAMPVRLAFLNAPGGRVLSHVAPNGGTYFAHTLLNVPTTADAQLAIQTWGSPQWQRHTPGHAADLPELPYLPVADVLDDDTLRDWLAATAHRDLLEWALAALLATPPDGRITLAAPADDVARVVYAATRVLPHGLIDDFTFSTYEPLPHLCHARLVGHDPGPAGAPLPAACYTAPHAACHPAAGKKTTLPDVPFAAFAVAALADGNLSALDEFRGTWQRLGLTDARQFDLVYRLARGTGALTKDETADALRSPALVAWVSSRADAVRQFTDWALDDRGFATGPFARVVAAVRQRPDAAARLADAVRADGLAAVKGGNVTRAANALEVVLPMAAPGKASAVWGDVLARLPDPAALSWEMRAYLLPRLVRAKQLAARKADATDATAVAPDLLPWLAAPPDRLAELLALDLPRAYPLAAARTCLVRDGEPTAAFAHAVGRRPDLALALLRPSQPGDAGPAVPEPTAVRLFAVLLAEEPSYPWFEDVLGDPSGIPAGRRNSFFEIVLTAGVVDADRLIRARGPALLELFADQSGLDRLARQFLAAPPADVFTDRDVLLFLGKLKAERQVGDDVKARIAAIEAVRAFLDTPALDADHLAPVAAALRLDPAVLPPAAKLQVFDAASGELTRRTDSPDFQRDLETVLLHLGAALSDGPAGLFRDLLRRQRTRRDFARHANDVHAFLAVALGAAAHNDVSTATDGLEAEAFAVAAEAAQKGGRRLLAEVDRRSREWPKAARSQWGFLHEAVRPKRRRLTRDVLVFLAGAATASAMVIGLHLGR